MGRVLTRDSQEPSEKDSCKTKRFRRRARRRACNRTRSSCDHPGAKASNALVQRPQEGQRQIPSIKANGSTDQLGRSAYHRELLHASPPTGPVAATCKRDRSVGNAPRRRKEGGKEKTGTTYGISSPFWLKAARLSKVTAGCKDNGCTEGWPTELLVSVGRKRFEPCTFSGSKGDAWLENDGRGSRESYSPSLGSEYS